MKQHRPDIVLFSSAIQYFKSPYKIINYFVKKKIRNIFFLKTPFFNDKEMIKVQIIPKHIYDASYPIRILNESRFLKLFVDHKYKNITHLFSNEKIGNILFKNFIFKLRTRKIDIIK